MRRVSPFVGEDGIMPAVSRPQAGRPPRLVYVRSFTDTNIWRVETTAAGAAATSPPMVAISSTRRDNLPDFSPDGRRVAFTSDRSGEVEIWVADTNGSNAVRLTSMNAHPGFPRWSPDGELVDAPLQSRGTRRCLRHFRYRRQASKSHASAVHGCVPQLLEGRPVDLFQLEPNGPESNLESPDIRWGCDSR